MCFCPFETGSILTQEGGKVAYRCWPPFNPRWSYTPAREDQSETLQRAPLRRRAAPNYLLRGEVTHPGVNKHTRRPTRNRFPGVFTFHFWDTLSEPHSLLFRQPPRATVTTVDANDLSSRVGEVDRVSRTVLCVIHYSCTSSNPPRIAGGATCSNKDGDWWRMYICKCIVRYT